MFMNKNFSVISFKMYRRFISSLSSFISTLRLKIVLSIFACRYGKNLWVDGKVIVQMDKNGSIEIGNNVTMLSRFSSNLAGMTGSNLLVCIGDGHISIGDNSGFSSTVFSSKSSIKIGKNVKIGCNVRIYDHDFHPLNYLERREAKDWKKAVTKSISIGDDVFIGANSIILKGVKIGDRSIIGAGSVVANIEIPPDSLVAGNPAKILRRTGVV